MFENIPLQEIAQTIVDLLTTIINFLLGLFKGGMMNVFGLGAEPAGTAMLGIGLLVFAAVGGMILERIGLIGRIIIAAIGALMLLSAFSVTL